MRVLFRVSAVLMMGFLAAGLVAVFRAPFSWPFRFMIGAADLLGIYFGWLLLRISVLLGVPRLTNDSASQLDDAKSMFDHPLVRRAIWVLLSAGSLLVATVVLGMTGVLR